MPIIEHLIQFAANVRADRRANPAMAGEGTALELLIAPRYQSLVESSLAELTPAPLRVLPEYRRAGVGRPDLAFALPATPARAFIELKEPTKQITPNQLIGHDRDQFLRFSELPLWALTNFCSLRLFKRGELIDQCEVLPPAVLQPDTSDADAEIAIRRGGSEAFERILLVLSSAPAPNGAQGRGTLTFITNRTFLTATGYGGLRQMLRDRFDHIRIIDFRGGTRGALPATVRADENVFQIKVGVCVLIADAKGEPRTGPAEVSYSSVWRNNAFTRREKLDLAVEATQNPAVLEYEVVPGSGMARFKPTGFSQQEWPSISDLFLFRSNGIVTYRDAFSYAPTAEMLRDRLIAWQGKPPPEAAREFKETRDRKAGPALAVPLDETAITPVSYRPLDVRFVYNKREFIDFPKAELQAVMAGGNVALIALPGGTGAGPATWSHRLLPDQHSFRGSYGGWIFPLHDPSGGGSGHFINPDIIEGLTAAYGRSVQPQQIFDAVLALFSATSYTTDYAHDLEDDFPHVPFPADRTLFFRAAEIGERIRGLQGFMRRAEPDFQTARLEGEAPGGTLDVGSRKRAFIGDEQVGAVALLPDQSLRISAVSRRAWEFSVSGYPIIYKWLKARTGLSLREEEGVGLLRDALDLVWRVEELLFLYDQADTVLRDANDTWLVRDQLGLAHRSSAGTFLDEPEADAEGEG